MKKIIANKANPDQRLNANGDAREILERTLPLISNEKDALALWEYMNKQDDPKALYTATQKLWPIFPRTKVEKLLKRNARDVVNALEDFLKVPNRCGELDLGVACLDWVLDKNIPKTLKGISKLSFGLQMQVSAKWIRVGLASCSNVSLYGLDLENIDFQDIPNSLRDVTELDLRSTQNAPNQLLWVALRTCRGTLDLSFSDLQNLTDRDIPNDLERIETLLLNEAKAMPDALYKESVLRDYFGKRR